VFIRECCVVGAGASVPTQVLYDAWVIWCEATGHGPGSRESFGKQLRAAQRGVGIARPRVVGIDGNLERVQCYQGINLRPGVRSVRRPA
jgi:putative DNA primase/helicase